MSSYSSSVLKISNVVNISTSVVIKYGDHYLLVQEKEKNKKPSWNFPSGKVNFKENLLEAATREVSEETGMPVKLTGLISVYYYTTKKNSYNLKNDRLTIRFNFRGEIEPNVEPIKPKEEIFSAWLLPHEIQNLLKEKQMRNWIAERLAKEALTGVVHPLDLVYVARK